LLKQSAADRFVPSFYTEENNDVFPGHRNATLNWRPLTRGFTHNWWGTAVVGMPGVTPIYSTARDQGPQWRTVHVGLGL